MILALLSLCACSNEPLKPWDRDLLAEQKMQLVPDPIANYLDAHIYFSKEASFGGQGVGGGGCGCN
jgi:hypothetical protein